METAGRQRASPNWILQSSSRQTGTLAVALGALGFLFLWLTNRVSVDVQSESGLAAAFWLGVLLVAGAAWVILFLEDIEIIVDSNRRQLHVSCKSLTGLRSFVYDFDDVNSVEIRSVGQSHRGIVSHHLVIAFKNDQFFKTQFWSVHHSEVLTTAERLAESIGCPCGSGRHYNPVNLKMFVMSLAGAILVYCAWYKLMVGPFCPAMWFGSAPAFIIGVSFLSLFRILRQVPGL